MAETIKLNLNSAVFSILLLNCQVFFIKSIKLTKSIYFSQFFSLRSIFNAGTVINKWLAQYVFLNRQSHMSAMTQNPVSVNDSDIDKEYIPGSGKSTAFIGHLCECNGK